MVDYIQDIQIIYGNDLNNTTMVSLHTPKGEVHMS